LVEPATVRACLRAELRHVLNEKPDRSAHMRVVVRLRFCAAEPNQAAAILASRWQSARALICLSKGS
jgi:hypothetical protein